MSRTTAPLAALVLVVVVLQATVVARLRLPGAPPDLVLATVVAVGLLAGSRTGMLTGFAAGLLSDATADHALGRLAAAYVLVGAAAGLLEGHVDSRLVVPALAGGGAAFVAVVGYAVEGVVLGDPRATGGALWHSLAAAVPYCAALTPVVVPPVGALLRRADRRP